MREKSAGTVLRLSPAPTQVLGTFFDPLSSLSWSLEQASELTSDSSQQSHVFFLEQVWSVNKGLETSCVAAKLRHEFT